MKALVLTSTFPRWKNDTTASFVCGLSLRLQKPDQNIIVLAPHYSGGKIKECWHSVGIIRFLYFLPTRFERVAYGPGLVFNVKRDFFAFIGIPLFVMAELFWTAVISRRKRVQLIHSHWLIPQGFIGAVFRRVKKIPHISTVHGGDLNIIKKSKILRLVCLFIIRYSDRITVNSTYTKKQLESVAPDAGKKISVIPMGIDPEKFKRQNADDLRVKFSADHIILSLGRLIDIKGTIYLIRALPEIVSHYPHTLLLIAGDGPEKERLYQESVDLGLEHNIHFEGAIKGEDVPRYLSLADVFVLPSISIAGQTEAQGVVLLEAMAAGCPVIGSNVGGIPDMIDDCENGFLVPEQDYRALAEKICQVFSDEKLQEKFRMNGLLKVQQSFTWDSISARFSELYAEIVNENQDS